MCICHTHMACAYGMRTWHAHTACTCGMLIWLAVVGGTHMACVYDCISLGYVATTSAAYRMRTRLAHAACASHVCTCMRIHCALMELACRMPVSHALIRIRCACGMCNMRTYLACTPNMCIQMLNVHMACTYNVCI